MEITLTSQNYHEVVEQAQKPVLIDFWATWCGPCQMIAPVIEEIANERTDLCVCKVNVDDEPQLANRFGVQFIPTLAVLKNGQVLRKESGYRDKAGVLALLEGE